ncbi:hypothetical protein BOTBODRAFT_145505 [Botryobasidium botryosum FD-172 SS1]|uniref:F-box domain-containing protein n=1 Tax=Botryobasidium botryosum (strain FD-172 SS1) TaxID=930990 RepID=A0A067MGK1_BOTB1|nr:hypothetical protein BOTBODRAFT_145505 [Botryobasidium botryosum FD-172 SS1]
MHITGDRRTSHGSNQVAPINRLPGDILSMIFQRAKSDLDEFHIALWYAHRDVWKPFHFLSNLSLVCRSWRDFVRSHPILWAILPPPSSTPFINLFLERSKTAPLAIGFYVTIKRAPHFPRYTTLLLPHLHRLNICMLGFEKPIPAEDAANFLCLTPAPLLERLELRCGNHQRDWFSNPERMMIFGPLFARRTPRLRDLKLEEVHIPLSASIFTGLARLCLIRVEYTEPDSVHQLTRILELLPHLTELRLHHLRFPIIIPDEALSSGAINLPHLEELQVTFTGPNNWALHTLSRVAIPPSCHLAVWGDLTFGGDLRELIPQQWHDQSNLPVLLSTNKLEISLHETGRHTHYMKGHVSGSKSDAFAIYMDVENDANVPRRVLWNLGRIFPMPSLDTVILRVYGTDTPGLTPAFAKFLELHPNIREITLGCEAVATLDLLLLTSASHLCPQLETLCLWASRGLDENTLVRLVESRTGRVEDGGIKNLRRLVVSSSGEDALFSETAVAAIGERIVLEINDN